MVWNQVCTDKEPTGGLELAPAGQRAHGWDSQAEDATWGQEAGRGPVARTPLGKHKTALTVGESFVSDLRPGQQAGTMESSSGPSSLVF